ncbi:MAG: hypothetical protein U0360_10810 [Dehalococcoidia bacterium]
MRLHHLALPIAVLASFLASCGGGGPAATPGAGTTSTPQASAPATPALSSAIRAIDFSQPPYVTELTRRAGGGEVPRDRVRYADLDKDGAEEAVVVVESGGTLGDIGFAIYHVGASGPSLAYFRKLAGNVDIRESSVVITEGAPGPSDPACCPKQLHETTVGWRNGTFDVTAEQTVPNPAAGPAS